MQSLSDAANTWRYYRSERRQLKRWIRVGRLRLSYVVNDGTPVLPFGAMLVFKAVACGADEVLITRRRLTGLREVETHPEFWRADYSRAFDEGLQHVDARGSASWAAREQHYARFHAFSRYDEYFGTRGRVELVGGYETALVEGHGAVMREQLARPWQLEIVPGEEWSDQVRGRACTVLAAERVCGVAVPAGGIGIRIEYEGESGRGSESCPTNPVFGAAATVGR